MWEEEIGLKAWKLFHIRPKKPDPGPRIVSKKMGVDSSLNYH